MKLRRFFGFLFLLLTFGVLAFVLLKPSRPPANLIILDTQTPSAAAFRQEITIRNVIEKDIQYAIEPNSYSNVRRVRTLKAGALDRISTDIPLKITYDNGSRRVTHTVNPGEPYSFRHDEFALVRIYPGSHGREDAADLAPYVPTPFPVVEKMLAMAGVQKDDVVYDIGCGDGRMVIAAARKFLARGVGIDIDPQRIEESRANAKKEGVASLTRFICMDATKAHFSEATVLALYLLPESLELLRPLFEKELKPGTRIVSHNYRIGGWEDRLVAHDIALDENGSEHNIYLYGR